MSTIFIREFTPWLVSNLSLRNFATFVCPNNSFVPYSISNIHNAFEINPQDQDRQAGFWSSFSIKRSWDSLIAHWANNKEDHRRRICAIIQIQVSAMTKLVFVPFSMNLI